MFKLQVWKSIWSFQELPLLSGSIFFLWFGKWLAEDRCSRCGTFDCSKTSIVKGQANAVKWNQVSYKGRFGVIVNYLMSNNRVTWGLFVPFLFSISISNLIGRISKFILVWTCLTLKNRISWYRGLLINMMSLKASIKYCTYHSEIKCMNIKCSVTH